MTYIALTIAGSDSSAGAGIQADLKTFSALKVYGTTAITVLTAQNTQGVRKLAAVESGFVRDQIDAVFEDMKVDAVKIGLLANAEIIAAVAAALELHRPEHVVVDPVMVSSSGTCLLDKKAVAEMVARIFPLASLITPNLDEAAVFLNQAALEEEGAMQEWAQKITSMGARAVLLKGGHLKGGYAKDVLYDGSRHTSFKVERIATGNTHGTGCTLSAAITAFLAQGLSLPQAVARAKTYITGAIKTASRLETGRGAGPLNHFWQYEAS